MRKSLILQSVGLVAAMSLIPAVSAGFAASDVDAYKELDQFMSIFEKVKSDYVDKVDDKTLIRGAIDGMLASLDPHSSFLDNRDFQNLKNTTDGNYGGLGLTVQGEDGVIKIVSATEDTPAARAGLKSGDYITNIDGKLIYGDSLDQAVDRMRGAPGTPVKITVVRPGRDKPFDLTLTREVIQIKAVKWEVKDRVGIINVNTFSKATGPGVKSAIVAINKALGGKPLGYVIDLRENPGGLLDQAVEVSDTFLDHGEIVSQRGREKTDIERFFARPGDDTHGAPLVVLVDAGTASAAEIVAGALQDQRRAIVMGVRSFGKGSVQTVMPLTDETALRLTIARYFTPSGRSVQENGIKPDIVVPQLTDPDNKTARPRLREADLRNHLVNQVKADDKLLEEDGTPDPRFAATADGLKKSGVTDYQLDYAVKTIARIAQAGPAPGPATATKVAKR